MANRSYRPKPFKDRKKALSLVECLIADADARFTINPGASHRLARRAKRIAMKHKLRLPSRLKRRICKGCYALLVPGKNCRIRTSRGNVVIYCVGCKKMSRVGYKKIH